MTRPERRGGAAGALLLAGMLGGCGFFAKPAPKAPPAEAHYLLGRPYEAGGVWYYPAENDGFDETGLAATYPADHAAGTTADGEAYDPAAMAAAMQTLPLPAIVTVTDLETGRQIVVRVNDRGPADPGRLIELTPAAAHLLGMAGDGAAQVRVAEDGPATQRLDASLGGGATLALAAAPVGSVQAQSLPPPGQGGPGRSVVLGEAAPAASAESAGPRVLPPLPPTVRQVGATPGVLGLSAGTFTNAQYAGIVAAKLAGLGGRVIRQRAGRSASYEVVAGPFDDAAAADRGLARALAYGVAGARIVVRGQGMQGGMEQGGPT